jgi:hypothetical protein
MNDTEQVLYIASASGQQWLEFSATGQINIYADRGFNLRSKGTLNLHSDKAVNIQGDTVHISARGKGIKLDTGGKISLSAMESASFKSIGPMTLHSMSAGSFAAAAGLKCSSEGEISLNGSKVNLNNGSGSAPTPAEPPTTKSFPDVSLKNGIWATGNSFDSICTVAPSHEPWKRTK